MYARVTQGVAREGKMEELRNLIENSLAPEMTQRPGSRGMLLLTHEGSRQGIIISLWKNREALEKDSSDHVTAQLSRGLPLMEEAPSIRSFKVSGMFRLDES